MLSQLWAGEPQSGLGLGYVHLSRLVLLGGRNLPARLLCALLCLLRSLSEVTSESALSKDLFIVSSPSARLLLSLTLQPYRHPSELLGLLAIIKGC